MLNREKEKRYAKFVALLVLFIFLLSLLFIVGCAATIDVDPCFTGSAALSGHVVSVTVNGEVVAPVSWHGDQIYLVPNGVSYSIEWTANSDLLGLAPLQSGTSDFVAECDSRVNHPVIPVSYSVHVAQPIHEV